MTETSTDGPRVTGAQIRDISRLRRPTEGRMVAGVAAGISRHLDIDPTIVRVLFGALTIFGGAGILLYCIAWLTVPEDGSESSAASDLLRRDSDVVMTVGLILAAIVAGMTMMGTLLWSAPNPWPVMVIALIAVLGLVLFSRRTDTPPPPPLPRSGPGTDPSTQVIPSPGEGPRTAAPGTPPSDATTALDDAPAPTDATGSSDPSTTPASYGGPDEPTTRIPPPPPTPPMPPRPPKPPRSNLLPVTLCLVLLAEGGIWIADKTAGVDVHPSVYPGVAMAIIAAALLVGAWYGRSRWLILFGAAASLMTMAAIVLGPGPYGQRIYSPTTAAAVADTYEHGVGELRIHLENVEDVQALDGRTIDIESGVGKIEVHLPTSIDATVNAEVTEAGDIDGIPSTDTGGGSAEATITPVDDADPDVTLNISLRLGQIDIVTVPCPDPSASTPSTGTPNNDTQGARLVPAACN